MKWGWPALLGLVAACSFGAAGHGESSAETSDGGDGNAASDDMVGEAGSGTPLTTADSTAGESMSDTTAPTTTMGADAGSSDTQSADATADDGTTGSDGTTGGAAAPLGNCAEILAADSSATDGVYTIDVDGEGGVDPFEVYCDMTTEEGGWTLVFAYGFTSYDPFVAAGNAVSVRPNWPITINNSVPVSTTPPLGLDDEGAIDFALWPDLGQSFMVRSNINNGIMCDELTGSLVTGTAGTLDCVLIEDVTGTCTDVVPVDIATPNFGFALRAPGLYYYWDGETAANWPTHDPCGTNMPNHLMGVSDPFGAIFVRP